MLAVLPVLVLVLALFLICRSCCWLCCCCCCCCCCRGRSCCCCCRHSCSTGERYKTAGGGLGPLCWGRRHRRRQVVAAVRRRVSPTDAESVKGRLQVCHVSFPGLQLLTTAVWGSNRVSFIKVGVGPRRQWMEHVSSRSLFLSLFFFSGLGSERAYRGLLGSG